MANQTIKLAVGGPVQAKYGTYLPRPADEELLKACQGSKFAYVLACRQIGKSSLMFETSEKLSQLGIKTALIDLNSIGLSVEADSWYFSLIDELARKLGLGVDVQTWWEKRPRLSTLNQRFLQFLQEVILKEIADPIVIFVDEIDMTLGLGFTDDFFAAIRSVHNDRAQVSAYHRLTFVLLGVATPDELIKDHTRTPFNIGQEIILDDFTKEECEPFRLALEAKYPQQGRHYFDQLYNWTNGHPYLTQKLCDALLKADALELEMAHSASIEPLVKSLFLAPEARGEDNIQFVQTRIVGDPCAQDMLKIYRRILENQEPVPDDEQSPPINRLKLYGLVVARNDQLEVRNKLYRQAFNVSWANEMLASVRLGLPSRYKILQEIGQGGFSTVYLAQLQDSGQTQSVALKILKSNGLGGDSTQSKRFKQEARAVARLEHPNIIRIFETSGDEEPSFIAMEYIPGGTLRERLKSGPLTRLEAMDIVRQIGAALTYAHEQGIIHRDVNPNNILLDTRPDPLRPILTDFGLVKLLLRDEHTQITSTSIIGTLDYMAPEQWRQEIPTPATDLYALALTFFEMLSGHRPFDSQGYYDLMKKHLDEGLPLLSGVAPEVGPFFDEVLCRAAAKEPAQRFNGIADFVEALEAANNQAEEVEQVAQQNQAAKLIEAAQGYIQKGRYNPDHVLAMIEAALEVYPGYLDALSLRGKIRLQQGQLEKALADYQQAYERKPDPSSKIGREYLELLNNTAEIAWQRQQFLEAVHHYQTIWQILPGGDNQVPSVQEEIWQRAITRLVEYYHHEANVAFVAGHPEQLDAAIKTLKEKIYQLETLKAGSETEDLQGKLKQLQVTKYENMIKAAQAAIGEINNKDTHSRFFNDDIFQHYATLDEAYQALSELEPEQGNWTETRRKKLRESVESRCVFAARALAKLEPDYEAALRHYKAIHDLEQTKYPGLTQELHLNLAERIAELQVKVDHDGKYNEIRQLIDGKEYLKALERLDQEFIRPGNYEHRDVAKWLWGLVYAKRYEGNIPPEWESLLGFEVLSKRLVGLEKERVAQLKAKLEPWSQARIFETIDRENKTLRDFEEQLKGIEALVSEAGAHGAAETPDIEKCRAELIEVRAQIQEQHGVFFQIKVNETIQKVEAWLQKVEDIQTLLQTGNPVKDIPEFFNKIDELQQVVEADPVSKELQALTIATPDIGRTIDQLKLRIRKRLIKVLIDDIGCRDEELVEARKEAATIKEELAQAQAELARVREETAALPQQVKDLGQRLESFEGQYEINRYAVPISLALAVIAGGVISPQIQGIPGISTLVVIALILLIVYFVYYVWIYYVPHGPRK